MHTDLSTLNKRVTVFGAYGHTGSLSSPSCAGFSHIQRGKKGVNLGLRLDGQRPIGRLVPSKIHDTMRLQVTVADVAEVDADLQGWLKRAYAQNA